MTPDASGTSLPIVGRDHVVKLAFDRFQRSGELVPHAVRGLIDESWRRCYQAGIDPARPPARAAASRSIRTQRTKSPDPHELLDASAPVMSQAAQVLAGSETMMVLSDAAGDVLATEGDGAAVRDAADIGLSKGNNWSELSRGTNGLGTALRAGGPVHVHGPEHYCESTRGWTCSATVVRDPFDGTVQGALSIAGPSYTFNPHLLPLAVASAARLRSALLERENLRRERLLGHALGLFSRRAAGGLMLFDRRGGLVTANTCGRLFLSELGLHAEKAAGPRVSALDLREHGSDGVSPLPEWLRAEWMEPILAGEERIGTVVHLRDIARYAISRDDGLPRYKLRRVIEFVDANIGGPISLDDLARAADMSRYHFHRQFKKSLGMTPHDYILHNRIERAKSLLIGSTLPLIDVARDVGFVDQSHFTSTFRRLTSMTPRHFRHAMAE
jgi:sigma-54 dependent transcriptional regulator, acetoin dehydrogenase operon transcriptional activator AcoR